MKITTNQKEFQAISKLMEELRTFDKNSAEILTTLDRNPNYCIRLKMNVFISMDRCRNTDTFRDLLHDMMNLERKMICDALKSYGVTVE